MMRFRWRSDTIEKARLPFKIARRDPRCSHEVYVASALMEFHHFARGRETSSKIFELGMKNFGESESYMLSYLEHLMHLEDDNNTRATFNRVLSSLPSDESRAVWALFVAFEAQHGTLEPASGLTLVKRGDGSVPRITSYVPGRVYVRITPYPDDP
jgi:cleavage stimulation factor subunit 3